MVKLKDGKAEDEKEVMHGQSQQLCHQQFTQHHYAFWDFHSPYILDNILLGKEGLQFESVKY